MRRYNHLFRLVASLGVVVVCATLTFMGCTEVDDSLGSEFIPGNQQLKIGTRHLSDCFETRLYRTDSIRTSNIEQGILGSTRSDTFGIRSAGFFTQFTWGLCPDSTEGFGYRPIFDSLMLGFTVSDFGGDTTLVRRYEVYEVVDDSFLPESADTAVFYGNFDIRPYLSDEPLFTFDFPNQAKGVYTNSGWVRLDPTEEGKRLIQRLMLLEGAYAGNSMDGYFDPEEWLTHFKGLYFLPAEDPSPNEQGAIYSFTLAESGMVLYGRNRNEADPSLIQDTTVSIYYFLDEEIEEGGVSINTIRHDYAHSYFADKEFEEQAEERSLTESCYVEGLGGIVTEITFTEELFEALEEVLETTKDEYGNSYNSLAINQAVLTLYDYATPLERFEGEGIPYWAIDWSRFQPDEAMINRMEQSIPRLGLYTSFKKLTGIADYHYVYEQSNGIPLNFGGYLNRSRGCYTMDVAAHLQSLWNSWMKDTESVRADREKRSIFLAPEAYSINTFHTAVTQGMAAYADMENSMKLELTYTLIK